MALMARQPAGPHMDHPLDPGFETRRTAIWHANRAWVVASAATIALAVWFAAMENLATEVSVLAVCAAVAVSGFTTVRVVRALNTLYRCPHCGAQPYQTLNEYKCGGLGPTRANYMSPTHCPKCGTRLR